MKTTVRISLMVGRVRGLIASAVAWKRGAFESRIHPWIMVMLISMSIVGCAVTRLYYVSTPVTKDGQRFVTKKGVIDLNDLQLVVRPAYRIHIGDVNNRFDPGMYDLQVRYYGDAASSPPMYESRTLVTL